MVKCHHHMVKYYHLMVKYLHLTMESVMYLMLVVLTLIPRRSSTSEVKTFPYCVKLDSGLSVPIILNLEWVKHMKDEVKLRPNDIWVVTFPKSDTTWTQQIV